MTTQQYDIGDMPVVTGTFRLVETDELADPTAITVKVRKPDGTVTTYSEGSLSNPSVGIWKFAFPFPLDQDGKWVVKMYGTETVVAAEETTFSVKCEKVSA